MFSRSTEFVEQHADGTEIPNLEDVPVAINDIGDDGLQLALQTQIVRINDVESDTEIRLGTDGDDVLSFAVGQRKILRVAGRGGDDTLELTATGDGDRFEVDLGSGTDTVMIRFDSHGVSQSIDGAAGDDTVTFVGAGVPLNLDAMPAGSLANLEAIVLSGDVPQSLTVSPTSIHSATDDRATLTIEHSDADTLTTGEGWSDIEADFRDGRYVHRFHPRRSDLGDHQRPTIYQSGSDQRCQSRRNGHGTRRTRHHQRTESTRRR